MIPNYANVLPLNELVKKAHEKQETEINANDPTQGVLNSNQEQL